MKKEKFNKYNKRFVFVSLYIVYFVFSMQAQVTIGSIIEPMKGALLDLKEQDEVTGSYNSDEGMILPRVLLTDVNELFPMLTALESTSVNKLKYTGLTVYNVNQSAPFEKGIYVWDGAKWNLVKAPQQTGIGARNGLSMSGSSNVILGGDLIKNTTIDIDDYNLIFNSNQGKIIGIGTTAPGATMQVENPNSIDPLILRNLQFITDANNEIDGSISDPAYYNLMISANGAIRKDLPIFSYDTDPSLTYNLRTATTIAPGDAGDQGSKGSGGSWLTWTRNGTNYDYVKLEKDGAYVFSFNLFGTIDNGRDVTVDAASFYISAFKNGTALTNVVDIAEITINRVGAVNAYDYASYSITLTISGKTGDIIRFKISSFTNYATNFKWTLSAGNDKTARRTNMIYWKL